MERPIIISTSSNRPLRFTGVDYHPSLTSQCYTIHHVRDWCKVRALVRAWKTGSPVPPIFKHQNALLTGMHRCAANDLMYVLALHSKIAIPNLIPIIDIADVAEFDLMSVITSIPCVDNPHYYADIQTACHDYLISFCGYPQWINAKVDAQAAKKDSPSPSPVESQ